MNNEGYVVHSVTIVSEMAAVEHNRVIRNNLQLYWKLFMDGAMAGGIAATYFAGMADAVMMSDVQLYDELILIKRMVRMIEAERAQA